MNNTLYYDQLNNIENNNGNIINIEGELCS